MTGQLQSEYFFIPQILLGGLPGAEDGAGCWHQTCSHLQGASVQWRGNCAQTGTVQGCRPVIGTLVGCRYDPEKGGQLSMKVGVGLEGSQEGLPVTCDPACRMEDVCKGRDKRGLA